MLQNIGWIKNMFLSKKYSFNVLSGVMFLIIFAVVYNMTDSYMYWLRDDGLITLSHAKNLIDFGFVGVNPSGERLEGFSAPVEFWIYTVLYGVFGMGYEFYAYFQLIICTFLLGYVFSLFFEKSYKNILIIGLSALGLTFFKGFFLWHGSVMENPITHVLFLATFYILYKSVKENTIYYPYAIIIFLATISRLDSVYHIAPLLAIFSVWWFIQNYKYGYKVKLKALAFSVAVFVLWVLYHIYRYIYFGDINPNTAYAQGISVTDRISNLSAHWDQGKQIANIFSWQHGLIYMTILIPVGLWIYKNQKSMIFLYLMIVCISATVLSNGLIFGWTRLDVVRSTTYAPIFVFLALALVLSILKKENLMKLKYMIPLYCILIITLIAHINQNKYNATFKDRNLCCQLEGFKAVANLFRKLTAENNLPRPMVSNPDLGIVSYRKEFNMFDAGWLGSKATTHLKQKYGLKNNVFQESYIEWFAPDFLSLHGWWACYYSKMLNSKNFTDTYDIVSQSSTGIKGCDGKTTLAKRKAVLKNATTPERILIDKMMQNISSELLKDELQKCENKNSGIKDCIYVARTAYRFAPELREKGMQADLEKIFSNSRTAPFDMFLIQGYKNPSLVHKAINFIEENIERNLKKISYASIKLNIRKKEHYQWNAKDNIVINYKKADGVQLSFNSTTAKAIDISFDNNDNYKFIFKYKGEKVAEKSSRKVKNGNGLALDTLTFDKAITFDTVEIIPSGGDRSYSIGHFIPK